VVRDRQAGPASVPPAGAREGPPQRRLTTAPRPHRVRLKGAWAKRCCQTLARAQKVYEMHQVCIRHRDPKHAGSVWRSDCKRISGGGPGLGIMVPIACPPLRGCRVLVHAHAILD